MDLDALIARVKASSQQRTFFHFTDRRNLDSIRKHGLLSTRQLEKRKIAVPAFGGNKWSLDADRAKGMDEFVHLCFMQGHPMVKHAIDEGRLGEVVYLSIRPEVIKIAGAMITTDVANMSGIKPRPAVEVVGDLDLEVIYTRTNWKDPAINARLQKAHRCELLLPETIPLDLITNLGNG